MLLAELAGMAGEKAMPIQYEFKMELDRQMTLESFQLGGDLRDDGQGVPAGRIAPPISNQEGAVDVQSGTVKAQPGRCLGILCHRSRNNRLGSTGPDSEGGGQRQACV